MEDDYNEMTVVVEESDEFSNPKVDAAWP